MRRNRITQHVVIVLTMLLGLALASSLASAQSGGSQQIASGETVTWNAEWALDPATSTTDEDLDLLVLSRGSALVGVGGTNFPAPAAQLRDLAIEAFGSDAVLQTVDRGDYDNVSYSIDISTGINNAQLAIFTLIMENPGTTSIAMLIAEPASFQETMEAAQVGVQIGNTSVFNGVDASEMQQRINASLSGSSQPSQPTPTPVAAQPTPTPAPQPTLAPAQPTETDGEDLIGDLNSGLGAEATDAAVDETPTPATSAPTPTSASTATVPLPNSVVIPSNGVDVAWSDNWTIDDQGIEAVHLVSDGDPNIFVGVLDVGAQPEDIDASVLAQGLLTQPGLGGSELVAAINVDDGRKIIVLLDSDPTGNIYLIYEMVLDPVSTVALVVTVFESDIDAGADLVASTIQVDGEPVFKDIKDQVPSIFMSRI